MGSERTGTQVEEQPAGVSVTAVLRAPWISGSIRAARLLGLQQIRQAEQIQAVGSRLAR